MSRRAWRMLQYLLLQPLGFFDPLNLASKGTAEDFARRRAVEQKHGRV